MLAVVFRVAKTRAPDTPLSWGEAYVAGIFIFFFMLLIYGIIPHQWLTYADNGLGWRPDKRGIPTGPIAELHIFGKTVIHHHLLWGSTKDISLLAFAGSHNRGRIQVNAQVLRDIIATMIYGITLTGNIKMILWWQKRQPAGTKTEKPAVIKESAFGRPVAQQG